MSTNANSEESASREVEKGRQASAWGRTEEALAHYRNVWSLPMETASEGLVFQKIRALVNAGVLSGRQGELEEAGDLLDRAVRLAADWPQSGRIQGAAFRSRINEVLLFEEGPGRKRRFEGLCREYVLSVHGEVHRQLLSLFDAEEASFLDKAPPDFNLDAVNPAVVWLGKGLFSTPPPQRPSPGDFFKLYAELPLGYKRGLHKNFASIVNSFHPQNRLGPLYGFETDLWAPPETLPSPLSKGIFPPPSQRSAIRQIQPFGDGWTWISEEGGIYYWKKDLREVCKVSGGTLWGRWHPVRQEWAVVPQGDRCRLMVVRESQSQEVNAPVRIEVVCPVPDGWVWVGEKGRWGTFEQELREDVPLTDFEPWTGGAGSATHLFLWSTSGRVLCRERSGQGRTWSLPAHRGRILSAVVRDNGLVTGGEDGRILFWLLDKDRGLKQVGEKKADGPLFFAEHAVGSKASYTALAGGRTLWTFSAQQEQETHLPQEIQGLSLNPEGQILWSDKKNQVNGPFGILRAHGNWAVALGWNSRKKLWASGCLDGTVCEWDTQGNLVRRTGWEGGRDIVCGEDFVAVLHQAWVTLKDFSGQERFIFSLKGEPILGWKWSAELDLVWLTGLGGQVGAFEPLTGRCRHLWETGEPVIGLDWMGANLVTWDYCGGLRVYNPSKFRAGGQENSQNWGQGRLDGVRWSKTGQALLWGSEGKKLLTYDANTGQFPFSLEGVHKKDLNDAAWDGKRLWTAGKDGRLVVWNMTKPEVEAVLREEKEELNQIFLMQRCVAIRPEGKNWLLCHRSDSGGGQCELTEVPGHRGRITAMAVGPDERLLASAGEDRTIRFFSLPDGKFMEKLTLEVPALGLSFSPGGTHLAYLDRNGAVGMVGLGD